MYIKYIMLEGFKSYKERTEIGPFDPHFNAITGLNGSGKSNILDAICFVLGLSSLQLVRAGNLGDLVYKGGTGGVTRASASIVFDNKDKTPGKCPVGYDKFDEIIVSRTVEAAGTCKYYLNSITSTKKAITDLFESVQLNITNPNFMIQQGKITKVIGMSPKQVLMMIEESVGGNAYQSKRDKAEQELENKERCLTGIRTIIDESISPEHAKQRKARDMLNEFQSVEQQRTRKSLIVAIISFEALNEGLKVSKVELDKILRQDGDDDAAVEKCNKEIEASKKRQQQMKKENTEKFKDQIESATKQLASEKKIFLTSEAKINSAKMDVDEAQKKVVEAEKAKQKEEKEMGDYKKKSANSVAEFEAVKADIANAQGQLAKAKEQENALKMGNIVDEEGNTCDARQELMRVEDEINKIEPDFQVEEQQFKDDQKNLKNLEQELKRTPSDDQVERDYNVKSQKVEQLKAEAVRRNINPDDNTGDITRAINTNKQKMDNLEREKQKIWNQNFHLSFQYNKQAVDNSKIHGCLYELIKLNQLEEWGGAMEVLGGGILSQVVIEDQAVGKALLSRGEMTRRTTLHPLSVFQSQNNTRVTQQELDRRLGPGKAVPAIDLIEYHPRYQTIVQHFFGGKVLCDTLETAKKVAFQMNHWAVSKIGDVADPGGTMQGGSRRNLGHLIKSCETLRIICEELKQLQAETTDLNRRQQIARANEEFMKAFEVAKRDLHNAEETRKLTKYSMLKKDVDNLTERLKQAGEKLKEWRQQLEKYKKEQISWKAKVDQIEHLRVKYKKDNVALISKWEKALETANKKYEAKQKHFGDIDMDIKSREALIADCEKEIQAALAEKAEYESVWKKMTDEFGKIQQKYQEKQDAYDAAVAESEQWNSEFQNIEDAIRQLNDRIEKIDIEKMKRNNKRAKLQETVEESAKELKHLTAAHRAVNFETEQVPPEERKPLLKLKHELAALNKNHEELRLRIDHDANERYENTKAALRDAESKLKKVESNRNELRKVIEKLDENKLAIVREAYDKVNEEFNKMMGTLLPDSAARLVPVNNDLNQGLHIHVQLGGVWKESLSELSGGQRSLVALALVLSLCMYNAAPFYVLDEIDSALDLNHTQNIGVLIKRKFTGTQFVCVSLKDGMYSNCNILFQVTFLDGRSTVKRCVRKSSNKNRNDEEADRQANRSIAGPSRRR